MRLNAADCSRKWAFTSLAVPPGSQPLVGSCSPPAFATLASGRTVVVFGSSSPEGAVYCLDATTGKLLWRFPTLQITHDQDVGAGPTVSDPGVNGYSAGAVYVAGKVYNVIYDLNLTTGSMRSGINENLAHPGLPGSMRSTAALVGATLYVGFGDGLLALDARTGAERWSTAGGSLADTVSSPAVSGAANDRAVLAGDTAGTIWRWPQPPASRCGRTPPAR